MGTMGENMERSNLYLKLFKLVFGSVTLFAQENELMLKVRLTLGGWGVYIYTYAHVHVRIVIMYMYSLRWFY